MSSAASKLPLKESKAAVRDRKIVFWTPVMIWPTGFVKTHRKETVEYRSDQTLHSGKYPHIPAKLQGGVIIDLKTSNVEAQVRQLLEVDQLATDEALIASLQSRIAQLKKDSKRDSTKISLTQLLASPLIQSLPSSQQQSIRASLLMQ